MADTKRPIIIDTDPGIDDAAAICAAIGSAAFDIRLVSVVAGNVSLGQTCRNALALCEYLGADIPVACGEAAPLEKPDAHTAEDVHGADGLGGVKICEPAGGPIDIHAVEAMRRLLCTSERLSVFALGPLTNIALLLRKYPETAANIERLYIMGGSSGSGNVTDHAEFNFFCDPRAAGEVLSFGIDITLAGLDVTRRALLFADDIKRLSASGRAGRLVSEMLRNNGDGNMHEGYKMHDVCTFAACLAPDLFVMRKAFVTVCTDGGAEDGRSIMDFSDDGADKSRINVCVDVDRVKFADWFIHTISEA